MPPATCTADKPTTATRAASVFALGLAARRALDCWQLARCPTPPHPGTQSRHGALHVVVPLYHEEVLVESLLAYWSKTVADDPDLTVWLVTTEKEGHGPETTAGLLAVDQRARGWPVGLRHLHVETAHRYRAVQINTATQRIRQDTGEPAERIWIGIYNADSRPDPGTFNELRAHITNQPEMRAYQQLAQYVRPADRPSPSVMEAFADHQNWWTYTRWSARVRRSASHRRLWAATSPFSTFGHGEFFRLDLLDAIGGIPDFAYADGLLVGWLLRFGGEPIGIITSPDWAEVPRRPGEIIGQHRAWMLGLLNVDAAAAHAEALTQRAPSRSARRLLLATHRAIPVLWGLRPLVAAAAIGWFASRPRSRAARRAAVGIVGYCVVPQLAGPVVRAKAGPHPDAPYRPVPLRSRWHSLPVPMLVDGLGFWPALWDKLRSVAAPPKTPR